MSVFRGHEFLQLERITDTETAWSALAPCENAPSVREVLKARYGGTYSDSAFDLSQIASSFSVGHRYFVDARDASLASKPLLAFYGMVNIAAGIILMRRRGAKLERLKQSHGLAFKASGKSLPTQRVRIGASGTFPSFNDYSRRYDIIMRKSYVGVSADSSKALAGKEFSLLELLCRIPDIKLELHLNVGASSRVIRGETESLRGGRESSHLYSFYCHDQMQEDRVLLLSLFPVLDKAVVEEHRLDALHTLIKFTLPSKPSGKGTVWLPSFTSANGQSYFISHIDGCHLSEVAIHYLAAFTLSNIVRYSPEIWESTLTRRENSGYIPVLSKFYRVLDRKYPVLVANELLNKKFII